MKALIAVASRHGSTEQLAQVIAGELRAHGIETEVRSADDVATLDGFDAVIVGSAIYAAKLVPAFYSLEQRCGAHMSRIPTFAFVSGPVGPVTDLESQMPADAKAFASRVGAVRVALFSGSASLSDLDAVERAAMKMRGRLPGDYRDFAAVRAWANDVASDLRVA